MVPLYKSWLQHKSKSWNNIILNIDGKLFFNSSNIANYINKPYTTIAQSLVDKQP